MTGTLTNNQRDITTATQTPTRLNRTKLTPPESAEGQDVVEGVKTAGQAAVSEAPVLITEREVIFSTAAAVPLPPKTARRSIALLRRLFMTSAPHQRPAQRRHYPPKRSGFLEQAAMAREMRRA